CRNPSKLKSQISLFYSFNPSWTFPPGDLRQLRHCDSCAKGPPGGTLTRGPWTGTVHCTPLCTLYGALQCVISVLVAPGAYLAGDRCLNRVLRDQAILGPLIGSARASPHLRKSARRWPWTGPRDPPAEPAERSGPHGRPAERSGLPEVDLALVQA